MSINSVSDNSPIVNDNPLLTAETLARAQYNPHPAEMKSSSYRFDTPLDIDSDGNYCHRLIITRLSDDVEITNEPHYSTESLSGAISDWTVQLNISKMSTAMWGK